MSDQFLSTFSWIFKIGRWGYTNFYDTFYKKVDFPFNILPLLTWLKPDTLHEFCNESPNFLKTFIEILKIALLESY